MVQQINESFAIFRDDTFPFLGGGNKARKMMALHKKLQGDNVTAIVTTGGIQSNHCRAVAIYCKKYGFKCSLVLHGSEKRFFSESGNARIMKSMDARITFCNRDQIKSTMDFEMAKFKTERHNPYYLKGGGHTIEGGSIYIDTIEELIDANFIPDYIFVPSGTGTTQAGILAGLSKHDLPSKVYGVSVGRTMQKAQPIVQEFYQDLCAHHGIPEKHPSIIVDDHYLCEGYERFNEKIRELSKNSIIKYGIPLDTTYTGKAFYGMKEIIRKEKLKGKFLFWYTGGIFNYLA